MTPPPVMDLEWLDTESLASSNASSHDSVEAPMTNRRGGPAGGPGRTNRIVAGGLIGGQVHARWCTVARTRHAAAG